MNEAPLKNLLYDWLGANETLFLWINYIRGEIYDDTMLVISHLADVHNFFYYLGAIVAYALISATIRKMRGKTGVRTYLAAWFGVFCVLTVGYAADGIAVRTIKNHLHFPRPYIAITSEPVTVLDRKANDPEDDYHSFPSGHASFATLLVVAIWPVLTEATWWLAILFIPAVCWSRISVGMHFPADVVGGVLISFIIVMLVRAVIYSILLKLFKLRC